MIGDKEICYLTSSCQVWTSFESNGECSNFTKLIGSYCCDETTIKSTRKKKPYTTFTVIKSGMNSIFKCMTDLFMVFRSTKLMNIPITCMITHKTIYIGIIKVTGWENFNVSP